MPIFKIEGYEISADDIETAKMILSEVKNSDTDALIIKKAGRIMKIDINEEKIEIYMKKKNKIEFHGSISKNVGDRLLDQIISNHHEKFVVSKKVAAILNQTEKIRIEEFDENLVKEFESTVPKECLPLYKEIIRAIDAEKLSYMKEIVVNLTGVRVISENWLPILHWFKINVLDSEEGVSLIRRSNFYQLRKAFVTTVNRMVKDGVRSHNNMKSSIKEKEIDWVAYAERKKGS